MRQKNTPDQIMIIIMIIIITKRLLTRTWDFTMQKIQRGENQGKETGKKIKGEKVSYQPQKKGH